MLCSALLDLMIVAFYFFISVFQFAGPGGLFGGAKPTKDPHGDGTVLVMEAFSLY